MLAWRAGRVGHSLVLSSQGYMRRKMMREVIRKHDREVAGVVADARAAVDEKPHH